MPLNAVFDGPKVPGASMSICRSLPAIGIGIAMVVAVPRESDACSCVGGWPTLEEAVRKAPAAVIARVVAQGLSTKGTGTAYVDVKVLDSLKGPKLGATIRVWDIMVGSSCDSGLGTLGTNSIVAFSLQRDPPLDRAFQEAMGIAVRPGDYSLSACGEYYRPMESEAVARQWASQVRKRGKDSK